MKNNINNGSNYFKEKFLLYLAIGPLAIDVEISSFCKIV